MAEKHCWEKVKLEDATDHDFGPVILDEMDRPMTLGRRGSSLARPHPYKCKKCGAKIMSVAEGKIPQEHWSKAGILECNLQAVLMIMSN